MKKIFLVITAVLCLCTSSLSFAQEKKATITPYTFANGATFTAMSPNGLWATAKGINDASLDAYPYLINLTTRDTLSLLSPEEQKMNISAGANDVTNDGKLVVGQYDQLPAFYHADGEGWEVLENIAGYFNAVTPDGKYAVGVCSPNAENLFEEDILFYVDGVKSELKGLPTKDITGQNQHQNRLIDISADGNIILGCMSFSYPGGGCCYYVYNRTTETYDFIGQGHLSRSSHVDAANLSNNGKWVTGTFNNVEPIEGETAYFKENYISYIYNVESKEFKPFYVSSEDYDHAGNAVSNDGVVLGCSPYLNPSRSLQVRYGDFWYPIEHVLRACYGINYQSATGYLTSGLALDISDDGKTIAAMAYISEENYVLTLPETFEEAAARTNLLSGATFFPEEGAQFATISQIQVSFDRIVEYVDGKATIYQGENAVRSSLSATEEENGKVWNIGFRTTTLTEGENYTVVIPAGMFRIPGSSMTNPEYTIHYKGRANKPVQMLSSSPAEGGTLSEISYNSPVTFSFDVPVTLVSTAYGELYQEGDETPTCQLILAYGGNLIAAYPSTTRYLYKDVKYTLKIASGLITDLMGNCGNEAIELHLNGLYERPLPSDGDDLLNESFSDMSNSLNNFLLYEGDHLTPTSTMQGMGFDADNTPWNFSLRDDDSDDYCAASTSMYQPAGRSDNWMSTHQIYVPSENYMLSWKSQSYLAARHDTLRVYVWECDETLGALSASTIERIKNDGTLVYCDRETAGKDNNTLAGDWTTHRVELSDYSGKNIYVIFADLNENQSMLFIDDIKIEALTGHFTFGTLTESLVEMQQEIAVSGYVRVVTDTTYTSLKAYFHNADKSICDTIEASGIFLSADDVYRFTFEKKLPLSLGHITDYTLGVVMGDETREMHGKVSNLAFSPTKRVVIEELTGAWCGNCPLGIVAFDYLSSSFKDNFIPIAIHTSNGGSDFYDFSSYSNYLGLSAAPTGLVNRIDTVYSPLCTSKTTGKFSYVSEAGNETWTDILLRELEAGTLVDINLGSCIYDANSDYIEVPVDVRFAVDMTSANYNVSFVILEDSLMSPQNNYFYNTEDPILGAWGKGGKYGSYSLITYNHVARSVIGNFGGMSGMLPHSDISSEKTYQFKLQTSAAAFSQTVKMNNTSVVCMLINANTGRIENAAIGHIKTGTVGIDNASADRQYVSIDSKDQSISVQFAQTTQATVRLYDLNGILLDETSHDLIQSGESVILHSPKKGMAVLQVITPDAGFSKKIIIR